MGYKEKITQLLIITSCLNSISKEQDQSKFKVILTVVFRKANYKLSAISQLSSNEANGDTILDLSRSILEDMINVEYMVMKGKAKSVEEFENYNYIEQKLDKDFLGKNDTVYSDEQSDDIEKGFSKYNEYYRRKNGDLFRNWAGKDTETMINALVKEKVISPGEKNLLLHAYIEGNRQNHLSPTSVKFYLKQKALDVRQKVSLEIGLGISLIAFGRIASLLAVEVGNQQVAEEIENLFTEEKS